MPIKAEIKILPSLNNLELTKVSSYGDCSQDKHYHNQVSFAVVTHGTGKFRFRDAYHHVRQGAIIKINPGEVHSSGESTNQKHLEYRVFYLSDSLVKDVLRAEDQESKEIDFAEKISYNDYFFSKCLNTHIGLNSEIDTLYVESAFTELLLLLLNKHNRVKVEIPIHDCKPSYLSTVIDYLHAYYYKSISLRQLSEISERSPSQVLRTFQKHIGVAPHAYQLNLRIIKAKEFLLQDMPISQTALKVGFVDQSHFHKHFKRITHVTPGSFINPNFKTLHR
ncbi:MAG: AraC family transcriptional regulator [Bacteroidota bacterium]